MSDQTIPCEGQMPLFSMVEDTVTETWKDQAERPKSYLLVRAHEGILSPDNWYKGFATLEEARAEMRYQVAALIAENTTVETYLDFDPETQESTYEFWVEQPDEDDYCLGDETNHAFFDAQSGPEWQIFETEGRAVPSSLDLTTYKGAKSLVGTKTVPGRWGYRYVLSEPNMNIVPVYAGDTKVWQAEAELGDQTLVAQARTKENAMRKLWCMMHD